MNVIQLDCGHFIAKDQLASRGYCFVCGPATTGCNDKHAYVKAGDFLRCKNCGDRKTVNPAPAPAPAAKPLTRAECLDRLKAAGYTGPVSYTMTKLRELVAQHTTER